MRTSIETPSQVSGVGRSVSSVDHVVRHGLGCTEPVRGASGSGRFWLETSAVRSAELAGGEDHRRTGEGSRYGFTPEVGGAGSRWESKNPIKLGLWHIAPDGVITARPGAREG